MAQLVACRAAVRRPRVRISARHSSGDPLPELAAMKKLEWISAVVMNECVGMNLYDCTVIMKKTNKEWLRATKKKHSMDLHKHK
jgi:hypothetical protein